MSPDQFKFLAAIGRRILGGIGRSRVEMQVVKPVWHRRDEGYLNVNVFLTATSKWVVRVSCVLGSIRELGRWGDGEMG